MRTLRNLVAISLVSSVSLITGCVTITEPVSIGEGRYMIALNARGGFRSDGKLLSQSIEKANQFCATQEKEAKILNTENSGVQMWTPQNNQVIFECLSK